MRGKSSRNRSFGFGRRDTDGGSRFFSLSASRYCGDRETLYFYSARDHRHHRSEGAGFLLCSPGNFNQIGRERHPLGDIGAELRQLIAFAQSQWRKRSKVMSCSTMNHRHPPRSASERRVSESPGLFMGRESRALDFAEAHSTKLRSHGRAGEQPSPPSARRVAAVKRADATGFTDGTEEVFLASFDLIAGSLFKVDRNHRLNIQRRRACP